MMVRTAMAAAVLVMASGCATAHGEQAATQADSGRYAAGAAPLVANLATADGKQVGKALIRETADGLVVSVTATAVPAGVHGVHIHAVGKCEAPDFTTAGGHWNPTAHQHGSLNPMGPHAGDLPNLTVAADGTGSVSFTVPGAKLAQLLDADGSAVVIHAAADDLKTDPSGNSGARIACGVLGIPGNA